jgi:hypothetical protein
MSPLFDRLDRYVARITLGAWVVCLCFLVGHLRAARPAAELRGFPRGAGSRCRRMGPISSAWLNVPLYYLSFLPFVFLQVAPFVTVVASMFAVTRLMGASGGRADALHRPEHLNRVLRPVLRLGAARSP